MLEQIHVVLGILVWTCNIKDTYIYDDEPLLDILAEA